MGLSILRDEIETVMNTHPQYREMLFRRGYLLTDGHFQMNEYPFYGIWSTNKLGSYTLLVQEKQTVYIQSKDGISAAIVGHAYNPFDMTCDENHICNDLINAYQTGMSAYFDKVSELTGVHVIFLSDGNKLLACQDACGMTGCYFGKVNGITCISEHPQLIADLFSLKMDPKVEKLVRSKCYNIGNRYLPGNVTPYKEIKRLGGNTYLQVENGFEIKRFYPVAPHAEFTTDGEKQAGIEQIGMLIHNGIECCTKKWDRCAISLSGGTDSKTTLACANGLYDKFSYLL